MAAPLLPLLLIAGAGAVVVSAASDNAASRKKRKPCDAMDRLSKIGPKGIFPAALNLVEGEINKHPPSRIREPRNFIYTEYINGEAGGVGGITVASSVPQIIDYANAAMKTLCGKRIEVIYERENIEDLKRAAIEDFEYYNPGEIVPKIEIREHDLPKEWIRRASIKPGFATPSEAEALGWLCTASTALLHGGKVSSPVLPSDILNFSDELALEYLNDKRRPIFDPNLVFSKESLIALSRPNKVFDVEMSGFLDKRLGYYLGDMHLADPDPLDESPYFNLNTEVYRSISRDFVYKKFGVKNTSSDVLASYFSMASSKVTRINNPARGKGIPPVYFIRFDDKSYYLAMDIGIELYAMNSGEIDIPTVARAALLAVSDREQMGPNHTPEEYLDRASNILHDPEEDSFPLEYVLIDNPSMRDKSQDRSISFEPILYELHQRIMSAVAHNVSNLQFK